MIRMAKLTDYGFVVLRHFVANAREGHTAKRVAEDTRIPLPTVSKLLKVLAQRGFLASQRGVNGGYRIAMDPRTVSLADVIDALEGPIAITDCSAGGCSHERKCPTRKPWMIINRTIREALEDVPLSRLAEEKELLPLPVESHG